MRLVEWSRGESPSQTLWIRGRYTPTRGLENPITRVAVKLIATADELRPRIPVISIFCQPDVRTNLKSPEPAETKGLTSVLYALIRQVLQILPPRLEMDIDMSESRLQCLTGRKDTWKGALTILEDLVSRMDRPAFCILEGLQYLEHSGTQKYLKKLLEVLRHRALHVLFLTTGSVGRLNDTISKDETLGGDDLRIGGLKEDLERHSQIFWK